MNEGALIIKAKQPVRAFIVNKDINLTEVCKVRIEWGIIKYPKGDFSTQEGVLFV